MHRFALGTVQIGLPYGARAGAGVMPADRAEAILERAWGIGIRAFDTAEAYGCAAERLSGWLRRTGRLSEAQVVTKLVIEPSAIADRATQALDRFDGAASRTVLSHGFVDHVRWARLADVVELHEAGAGQSVYEPDEVRQAVSFPRTVRVQAPGNIFDDRASVARGSSPVALDLRSVFLQGVLLLNPEDASRRVFGGDVLSRAVSLAAAAAGGTASELLLAVMLQRLGPCDRIVIGADHPEHLSPITAAIQLLTDDPSQVEVFEHDLRARMPGVSARLLDPRQWNS